MWDIYRETYFLYIIGSNFYEGFNITRLKQLTNELSFSGMILHGQNHD